MYILLQRQAVSSGLPDINTARSVRSFSMYQNWKGENEDLHVTQVGSTWISVNDMALRCFAEVTLTCSVIVTAWLWERERFVEAPSSQILANTQNIRQLQIGETLRIKPKPDKTCEKEVYSLSWGWVTEFPILVFEFGILELIVTYWCTSRLKTGGTGRSFSWSCCHLGFCRLIKPRAREKRHHNKSCESESVRFEEVKDCLVAHLYAFLEPSVASLCLFLAESGTISCHQM